MTSLVSQSGYGLMNGPIDRQHAIFLGIHWSWTDVGRSPDAGFDLPFDETLAAKVKATLMRFGGALVADNACDLVCSLESAQYAIEAASEISRQCDRESAGRHIALRMGILIEDASPDSPTKYAQAISRASRLARFASPGQTLIRAVGAAVPESLRRRPTPADTSEWDELPESVPIQLVPGELAGSSRDPSGRDAHPGHAGHPRQPVTLALAQSAVGPQRKLRRGLPRPR